MNRYTAQAFSLIEVIIVTALIAIVTVPLLINGRTVSISQGLKTSVQLVSNDLVTAKIYSREGKNQASWGIRTISANQYELIYGTQSNPTVQLVRQLEERVVFENNATIWFGIGSGETSQNVTINLIAPDSGKRAIINVNTNGLVEYSIP